MGKLGKILAPIVAVLAIAAAGLSFLISDGFKKYQDRANKMAKGLVDTSAKLDAQTNTGKASSVRFTPASQGVKENGSLSFADYKANSGAFGNTVNTVAEIADKVVAQRNDLTEAIKDMSIKLGMKEDDIAADDMKDINSYQAKITLAKSYAEAYEERDREFVNYIKKYANALGQRTGSIERKPAIKTTTVAPAASSDEDGEEEETAEAVETKVAKFESNSDTLEAINRAIVDMKACKESYEKAIKATKSALSNYTDWQANVDYLSERNYQSVLTTLTRDLAAINSKLGELARVKRELSQTQSDLRAREGEVTELKQNVKDDAEKISKLEAKVKELTGLLGGEDEVADIIEDKPAITKEDVKEDTIGKVMIDNHEWNYVITNLGNTKVAVGTELVISSANGKYLASGKVKKVEGKVSLVEITRRADGKAEIPVGSTVMISSKGIEANED